MRDRRVRGTDLEAELARKDVGSLLADEESRAVRVGAEVVGADRQIGDLETLCAVDVELAVDDASLLARLHG